MVANYDDEELVGTSFGTSFVIPKKSGFFMVSGSALLLVTNAELPGATKVYLLLDFCSLILQTFSSLFLVCSLSLSHTNTYPHPGTYTSPLSPTHP
jgi:hypothetical protein